MGAMAEAPTDSDDVHERLCRIMHPLTPSRSTLLNGISSHVVADAITLTQIDQMHRGAQTLHPRMPLYIGSIYGKIRVSARLEAAPTSASIASSPPDVSEAVRPGRKRQRVSEADERAEEVVAGVKKRMLSSNSSVSAAQLEAGRQIVRQIVDVRGSGGESVLEAIGMSVTDPTCVSLGPRRPRLMLSARFTPGVAISLGRLRAAIRVCSDGALTTATSGLGTQFSLPSPPSASDLAADGQMPMFLHVAVPEPPRDALQVPGGSTLSATNGGQAPGTR